MRLQVRRLAAFISLTLCFCFCFFVLFCFVFSRFSMLKKITYYFYNQKKTHLYKKEKNTAKDK